jgi:hypothetical protein
MYSPLDLFQVFEKTKLGVLESNWASVSLLFSLRNHLLHGVNLTLHDETTGWILRDNLKTDQSDFLWKINSASI